MPRYQLLATVVVALSGALTAPAAPAVAPSVTVPPEAIDWTNGTVMVAAEYPAGTRSVIFWADWQWISTITVADATLAGTVSSGVPFLLAAPTEFRVDYRGEEGLLIGTAALALSPEMYRPSAPRLALERGAIVGPSFTLQATSNRTVTGVTVETGPEPLTHPVELAGGADGRIAVSGIRVPYGVERIRLTARNGFGSSPPSAARALYNLGPQARLPKRNRYLLVDKRSMTLYDVRRNHVLRHFDIAIGIPSAPTPNGYFKLGGARPASGAWGVLRRPLYRFGGSKRWASGFYIHGTDAPWDIGTWASHGCVRIYNWAIRMLTRTVPNGTLVRIRR
jgi:hypothetical protein